MNQRTDCYKRQFAFKYEQYKNSDMHKYIRRKGVMRSPLFNALNYVNVLGVIVACTVICLILHPYLHESNLIMVYLLGVTMVALMGQTGPAVLASFLCVLAYDYFFIEPFFSFSVSDIEYVFTLMVMLIVGQTISHLTIRVRRHIEVTQTALKETEKERFRNLLLTSVSHDLRTPLTAIMGSASSILQSGDKLSADLQHELVQNIFDESERLSHLVNNILKLIRLEAGSMALSRQRHALDEIISSVLTKLDKQLAGRPVNVSIPEHLPLVPLDNILIEQVLINLLENAIKFTPANSALDIVLEQDQQDIKVAVVDRGPGIQPDDADKIFDKFYRGQKPETSGVGLGLGLAICKGIILAHNGKIWVQPRDEGGAAFCFSLPLTG